MRFVLLAAAVNQRPSADERSKAPASGIADAAIKNVGGRSAGRSVGRPKKKETAIKVDRIYSTRNHFDATAATAAVYVEQKNSVEEERGEKKEDNKQTNQLRDGGKIRCNRFCYDSINRQAARDFFPSFFLEKRTNRSKNVEKMSTKS